MIAKSPCHMIYGMVIQDRIHDRVSTVGSQQTPQRLSRSAGRKTLTKSCRKKSRLQKQYEQEDAFSPTGLSFVPARSRRVEKKLCFFPVFPFGVTVTSYAACSRARCCWLSLSTTIGSPVSSCSCRACGNYIE